jgi:hypothetical protein
VTDPDPRPLTRDEVQKHFLEYIEVLVDYWERAEGPRSTRDRLEGLAFSILVMLDGESALPKFSVCSDPHPNDKEFHRSQGENWFPEEGCDIAGDLHERFFTPKDLTQ